MPEDHNNLLLVHQDLMHNTPIYLFTLIKANYTVLKSPEQQLRKQDIKVSDISA